MKDLQIEKEKLEFQLKTSSPTLSLSNEENKSVSVSEIIKPATALADISLTKAETVVSVISSGTSELPKALSGSIEESSSNPFEEDMKDVPETSTLPETPFDYIIPIRTTYRIKDPTIKFRETVEFAASVFDVSQGKIIATFQRFVKPDNLPKLTEKEQSVLRIRQEQIDSAKGLADILNEFDDFLNSNVFRLSISINNRK